MLIVDEDILHCIGVPRHQVAGRGVKGDIPPTRRDGAVRRAGIRLSPIAGDGDQGCDALLRWISCQVDPGRTTQTKRPDAQTITMPVTIRCANKLLLSVG